MISRTSKLNKAYKAYTDALIKAVDWSISKDRNIVVRVLLSIPLLLLIIPIYGWVCLKCAFYSYRVMKQSEETLKHFTDLLSDLDKAKNGPPPLPPPPIRPRPRRVREGSTRSYYKNEDGSCEPCPVPIVGKDFFIS